MAIKLKVGIMGLGMVGGALERWLKKQGQRPLLYDPPKNLGSKEEINQADIVFVCVPTPYRTSEGPVPSPQGEGFDLSFVLEACAVLTGEKIVVIKSTVVPGTTEALQEKYPNHHFLFNPEFLREARADEDMANPDRQIIGITKKSAGSAKTILALLPKAPFEKIIPATAAELVKYAGNTFLAMKVVFAGQIYQLCQALGLDYDVVKECVAKDKRIGESHLNATEGGYLGYSGACFPKDIRSLIQFADSKGIDLALLKTVENVNKELIKKRVM